MSHGLEVRGDDGYLLINDVFPAMHYAGKANYDKILTSYDGNIEEPGTLTSSLISGDLLNYTSMSTTGGRALWESDIDYIIGPSYIPGQITGGPADSLLAGSHFLIDGRGPVLDPNNSSYGGGWTSIIISSTVPMDVNKIACQLRIANTGGYIFSDPLVNAVASQSIQVQYMDGSWETIASASDCIPSTFTGGLYVAENEFRHTVVSSTTQKKNVKTIKFNTYLGGYWAGSAGSLYYRNQIVLDQTQVVAHTESGINTSASGPGSTVHQYLINGSSNVVPVAFIKPTDPNAFYSVLNQYYNGTKWVFSVIHNSLSNIQPELYIYNQIDGSSSDNGWGLQVFDNNNQCTFDSTKNPLSIEHITSSRFPTYPPSDGNPGPNERYVDMGEGQDPWPELDWDMDPSSSFNTNTLSSSLSNGNYMFMSYSNASASYTRSIHHYWYDDETDGNQDHHVYRDWSQFYRTGVRVQGSQVDYGWISYAGHYKILADYEDSWEGGGGDHWTSGTLPYFDDTINNNRDSIVIVAKVPE